MTDELFNLVFSGELVKGAQEEAVKANLASMFKLGQPQIEKMFSGHVITLKKNIDADTGRKLRAKFKQAGVICRLESFSATAVATQDKQEPTASSAPVNKPVQARTTAQAESPISPPAKQTDAGFGTAKSGSAQTTKVQAAQAASQQKVSQSGLTIAPAGADVLEGYQSPEPPPPPNVDAITMAPAGSDLVEEKPEVEVLEVDISGISLVDAKE